MLSGLVSMRKDCINSDLGIVCSNHSDINGKDAMEDRQFSLSSVNEAMDLGDKAPAMAFFGVYDGHSGEDCAEYIRLNLHAHVFSDIPALLSNPKTALKRAFTSGKPVFMRSAWRILIKFYTVEQQRQWRFCWKTRLLLPAWETLGLYLLGKAEPLI